MHHHRCHRHVARHARVVAQGKFFLDISSYVANLSLLTLLQRLWERFGDSLFKIGESDSGRKLKVTLKECIQYALFNRDDSPLYLFESNIEHHPQMKEIINEYEVPRYLRRDFFVELVSHRHCDSETISEPSILFLREILPLFSLISSERRKHHHTDGS